MPRRAREKSNSGIYHVMIRGANRQEIFHDEEDCVRFLETLERYKKKSEMGVYGWCLMGNHVHLLLHEGIEELAVTMKRIGVSYACYYNSKYKTTGHLFQDRYKSEKIESDEYLLTAIRYIHQNPNKAGMIRYNDEWRWSSCRTYYEIESYPSSLLDSELILAIFSDKKENRINKFKEYNETGNEDICLDDITRTRLTDDEAKILIDEAIKGYVITELKVLPKSIRNELLAKAKKINGINQRQLSRIFGISLALINRAQ